MYAGDESMHSKTRTFGVVAPSQLDVDLFVASLKKQGVTLATPPLAFTANGSPLGDTTTAQAEAPTLVGRLKAAGVTSVIMFTDVAMTGSLTKFATRQEYRPEWVMTGYSYQDLTLLGRASYDQDQWAHAFGLSSLWPLVRGGNVNTSLITWYWGPDQGTVSIQQQTRAVWLAAAIQYAGPNLTPKNVQRGFFASPAIGGAASDSPAGALSGYGRAAGLPYDSYAPIGKDFGAVFYDSTTEGGITDLPDDRGWRALVPEQRQALHRRHLAEAPLELLRQVRRGLRVRHIAGPVEPRRGLHRLPELGWTRHSCREPVTTGRKTGRNLL